MEKESRSSLSKLIEAYDKRDLAAIQWSENQGQTVGFLGSEVPEELLIAAGFLPIKVAGTEKTDTRIGSVYLESGFDPMIHAQFTRLVEGSYSYLDHLIVSNSSDALIRSYYYLRALHHVEREVLFPKPFFHDFLHTKFHSSALYNRDRTKDLINQIEVWTGEPLREERIVEAIKTCNETRTLLKKMDSFRRCEQPRISGVHALKIIGASMFMEKVEFNNLLKQYLDKVSEMPVIKGVRLFVTGSSHEHTQFYEAIEREQAVIVGEDHENGSRYYEGLVDQEVDPIDGIVDRYHYRFNPSSQATVSERVASLSENVVAAKAQGVISFIYRSDDAPSWDFPEQKKILDKLGIPVLLLDKQDYKVADEKGLRKKLNQFIDEIKRNSSKNINIEGERND
ncbi:MULTISPECIES: 2-hydroxyacyl-CoA dehydratase subunit D [Bacillaceae]|uniref:2-hydroxyacyl-CoA dehydratase family protein n=1 Tax=Evansella alkalicola TaxID=745819 RepID=A0ABS6K147_9BACI|nr:MULTISPECIES: 2-hydroxyacyl-CoA dehydratase family protein [Bacillaceae]MBU9723177.1 2-hydroxyacyl-CoA dehydratase family protein [Bacillus alkalicola]